MNTRIASAVLLSIGFLAAGCGESTSGAATQSSSYRFAVVTHGAASQPFWAVTANGVKAAAQHENVIADYQAPATFDLAAMSGLIDSAVASKVDGLIVSIPDAAALGPAIARAVAAGIPVISIDSGSDTFRQLGVLLHIGQTEEIAGVQAGEEMKAAGVRHALCVNHEVGNAGLEQRCTGFAEGLAGTVEVLEADAAQVTGAIREKLEADATIDGILLLGSSAADPAIAALRAENKLGALKLATFDLSTTILQEIVDGNMLFAVDQAQYLQGYLAVVSMAQYLRTGAVALGSADHVLLTGPQFVTHANAQQVIQYAERGVR